MGIGQYLNTIKCSSLDSFIEKWKNDHNCEIVKLSRKIYANERDFFDTSSQQILAESDPIPTCLEIFKVLFNDGDFNLGRFIALLTLLVLVHEKLSEDVKKNLMIKTSELFEDLV